MRQLRLQNDEWIETPAGWLSRQDLEAIADRLLHAPVSLSRRIIIDWSRVRHCDFRGLPALGAALVRLRDSGVTVIGFGLSDYLLAIALVGLSTDEAEIFADFAEETGRSSARGAPGPVVLAGARATPWGVMEN